MAPPISPPRMTPAAIPAPLPPAAAPSSPPAAAPPRPPTVAFCPGMPVVGSQPANTTASSIPSTSGRLYLMVILLPFVVRCTTGPFPQEPHAPAPGPEAAARLAMAPGETPLDRGQGLSVCDGTRSVYRSYCPIVEGQPGGQEVFCAHPEVPPLGIISRRLGGMTHQRQVICRTAIHRTVALEGKRDLALAHAALVCAHEQFDGLPEAHHPNRLVG